MEHKFSRFPGLQTSCDWIKSCVFRLYPWWLNNCLNCSVWTVYHDLPSALTSGIKALLCSSAPYFRKSLFSSDKRFSGEESRAVISSCRVPLDSHPHQKQGCGPLWGIKDAPDVEVESVDHTHEFSSGLWKVGVHTRVQNDIFSPT